MFNAEQIKHLKRASNDFVYFTNNIFSAGVKGFVGGEYIDDIARFLSQHRKTIRVSARDHCKSFLLYSHFMWRLMFEGADENLEAHYFSFNADLAAYHISKIKSCISSNPYFEDCKDGKPTAESVLKYSWDGKHHATMTPHGLVQFKRGIHARLIYCDDPFQDPENDLNPTIIYKINEIFKSNIMDMPTEPDGELHVVGTAQTDEDFFFDKNIAKQFAVRILPAIYHTEEGEEKALWPEWMSLEELKTREEIRGKRIFQREYMCKPAYSTRAYFDKDEINKKIVNHNIVNLKYSTQFISRGQVVAGFDIGKKAHPAHLAVFEFYNNKLTMIHERWMDGWNYSNGKTYNPAFPTQLEYLKLSINNFKITKLFYDNTRGEFESFDEQGLLPRQMEPIVFTVKTKNSVATEFDKVVEKRQIEIIDNQRTIDQICSVTNTLQAPQSASGHGESFWSIGLAVFAVKDSTSEDEYQGIVRKELRTGQKSIFSDSTPIPEGW